MTQAPTLTKLANRAQLAAKTLANVRDDLTRAGITNDGIHAIAQEATHNASHIASILAYHSTRTEPLVTP